MPPATRIRAVAATMTAGLSAALAATSARQFLRRGTTLQPLDPSEASVLVTTGSNAITRNPMYVGLAGLLVANAIRRGSWAALLPVGGFVLLIDRLQIMTEERALAAKFGAEYESYVAAVPRWLDQRSLPR
jgi:protein-S-isoprenylcysteine O-methyltransferase Ste14